MNSGYVFSIGILLFAILVLEFAFGWDFKAIKNWWKTKKFARFGVVAFTGAAIVIGLLMSRSSDASEIEWFPEAEAYFGVDAPFTRISPQCDQTDEGFNREFTSNGGIRVTAVRYRLFSARAYTLHKSCAVANDWFVYDGVGAELVIRLW